MDFDQACRIKNPHGISFNDKMDQYVRYVGRENLEPLLPFSKEELAKAYLEDRHFNNLPLHEWEAAAGYPGFKGRQVVELPRNTGRMGAVLASRGITAYSMSECVSLLKHVGEMAAMDWIRAAVFGKNGPKWAESWAVFENQQSGTDLMNRYNIFDFDCVATFATEQEAIDFESKNPQARVRKLVKAIRPYRTRKKPAKKEEKDA